MPSLYSTTCKAFESRQPKPSFTTPGPRINKRPEVDLESFSSSDTPRPALPSTPDTPSPPCLRRQRATTLSGYSPPCMKSTQRGPTVASRSSGFSFAMESDFVADNRVQSNGSLYTSITAPSTYSEETSSHGGQDGTQCRALKFAESETLMPGGAGKAQLTPSDRDFRYANATKIKGTRSRGQIPFPFKCLSPMKTLSFASSTSHYAEKRYKRTSPVLATMSLSTMDGLVPRQEIGYFEHSCSVDRGLLMMEKFLGASQSENEDARSANDENLGRRPWSVALPINDGGLRMKNALSGNSGVRFLEEMCSSFSQRRYTRQAKQLLERWRSSFGLYDVSYVKRTFSVMRADVAQDEQDIRKMFNRESVWTYRKSVAPSKVAKFRSKYLSANMKPNESTSFVDCSRTRRKRASQSPLPVSSRRTLSVACFNGTNRPDGLGESKARHRSAAYGLITSPSMHHQIKVERIKRQRKLRQEMMTRVSHHSSRRRARDTYDWFAEDIQYPDCEIQPQSCNK